MFIEEFFCFDKKILVLIICFVGVFVVVLKNFVGVKDVVKLDLVIFDCICVVCGNMVEVKVCYFYYSFVIIVWYV